MSKNKEVTRKKVAGFASATLALALIITGTFAWRDVSQHKTNKFKTTDVQHNVVLVEDFEEVENWKKGQEISKLVSVRNGQETDDNTKYIYDDAYVRIQFKEFMEIGDQDYIYNEERLMIDEKGNFKRYDSKAEAQTAMSDEGIPNDARIVEIKGYFDDAPKWYIATEQKDKNGQYGKFLIIDIKPGESVSIDGGANQNHASDDQHQVTPNDEDNYSVHRWDAANSSNGYAKESPFTEYVSWKIDNTVMTMKDWIAGGKVPVKAWVIDTDSEDGWVYWGTALKHGSEPLVKETLTTDFLEAVTLVKQPEGASEYYIHVNLDAVSLDELNLWKDDAPLEFIEGMGGSVETNAAQRKQLVEAIKAAQDKLSKMGENVTSDSKRALEDEITKAETILSKEKATKQELVNATKAVNKAANGLKKILNVIGDTTEGARIEDFGGHDWTISHINEEGQALIIADMLTEEDFNAMNVEATGLGNRISFQQSSSGVDYAGYNSSYLKVIDDAFYNTFISTSEANEIVLPIYIEEEDFDAENWNTRVDKPTVIDKNKGKKASPSLSVSDINLYEVKLYGILDEAKVWMRSPGEVKQKAAVMENIKNATNEIDALSSYHVRSTPGAAVKPTMWIQLPESN